MLASARMPLVRASMAVVAVMTGLAAVNVMPNRIQIARESEERSFRPAPLPSRPTGVRVPTKCQLLHFFFRPF